MRVVMDGYWWSRGTESLRRTVRGLVGAWRRDYPQDELIIVARRTPEPAPMLPGVEVHWTRAWPHALAATTVVPAVAVRHRADAVVTHNFAPQFGHVRCVLIHDLLFVSHPEWFTAKELAYYRWMAPTARRADIVFSTTRAEGRRIAAELGGRNVVPIGLGIEHLDVGEETGIDGVRDGRFLLAVGRLNARKNLANAVAGAVCSGLLSPSFPLLIAGESDGLTAEWPERVEQEVARGTVRFLGFVDDDTLRFLTRRCAALICLSLGEGFGLPPVEAAAVGTPVVVSDLQVFRENLGAVATYVDPNDPVAIGAALREVVRSGARIPTALSEGLRQRHSWGETVYRMRSAIDDQARSDA